MEGYIDIREALPTDTRMTTSLETVVMFLLIQKIIPINIGRPMPHMMWELAMALLQRGIIGPRQYNILIDSRESLPTYLTEITRWVSFDQFICALRSIGCSQSADLLVLEKYGKPEFNLTYPEERNSMTLNRFYNYLMAQVQSSNFRNKFPVLEHVRDFIEKRAATLSDKTAQYDSDKVAVVASIMINHCDTGQRREDLFSKLKDGALQHYNTCEIAYSVTMCTASRKAGRFTAAEDFLTGATILSDAYNDPLFKLIVLHERSLLHHMIYAAGKGTNENLEESTKACELGMSTAVSLPKDVSEPWLITFMLYYVMLQLRVGLPEEPTETSMREAEAKLSLLSAKIQSPFGTIRREMMYNMSLAKLHKRSDKKLAIKECEKALALAKDGGAYTEDEIRNVKCLLGPDPALKVYHP